jgi:hypothetical protein
MAVRELSAVHLYMNGTQIALKYLDWPAGGDTTRQRDS